MQISVKTKPDPTTDLIFMQKLADYCEEKGINLSIMTTPTEIKVVFEGAEEQLTELKEYLEKKKANA